MRLAMLLLALALGLASFGQEKTTLYERLGRYDGIARITDEYLRGVRSDPQLARFIGRGSYSKNSCAR